MPTSKLVLVLAGLLIVTGIILGIISRPAEPVNQSANQSDSGQTADDTKVSLLTIRSDYAQHNSLYQFSAELPEGWVMKYVPATEAVAAYPPINDENNLDQAQIFIRHFEASRFETLSTVNVLSREETTVNDHAAIMYEIEKKPAVANFINQPAWRSAKHRVTDVRLLPSGKTSFFVFAADPTLNQEIFAAFIASVRFYNDRNSVHAPITTPEGRVSKKSFGTKVSPTDSPVQPEKFSGFHTGWDFEIFPDELKKDVIVSAFCGGKVRVKETASGYGGLLVQDCNVDNVPMTVVYGHLQLASVEVKVGAYRAPGDRIGLLGDDNSNQTDGERKHLHFGLHKGTTINIRGYIASQTDLVNWIDPKDYL